MDHIFNQQLAVFVLRCVTGILFLFQGYEKVFRMKAGDIVNAFQTDFERRRVPEGLLKFTVRLSAFIELAGGIMLLLGFQRELALYFLSIEMIFVTFAFSMLRPMWDMQYFFPRFVLLITLLLLPAEWDEFSLDHLIK